MLEVEEREMGGVVQVSSSYSHSSTGVASCPFWERRFGEPGLPFVFLLYSTHTFVTFLLRFLGRFSSRDSKRLRAY